MMKCLEFMMQSFYSLVFVLPMLILLLEYHHFGKMILVRVPIMSQEFVFFFFFFLCDNNEIKGGRNWRLQLY